MEAESSKISKEIESLRRLHVEGECFYLGCTYFYTIFLLNIHMCVFEITDSNRLDSDLEELNCSLDLVASQVG